MRIDINVDELKFDIRNKSHEECAVITDPQARYRAEAGTDKNDEIERCIIGASAVLCGLLQRFLRPEFSRTADNTPYLPETLLYYLELGERRVGGKAQALADAVHSFLVNQTLTRFYVSVAQGELAGVHDKFAAADAQLITTIIYTKTPPFFK